MSSEPKLYTDLASWWPLLSPPEEYAEEATSYGDLIFATAATPPRSLLELGSGGGNNASYLKSRFERVVLVDCAPGMLALSRALNPTCEHLVGDMREVRLEQTFDVVFIHDAICYMTSLADLRRAADTAFVHCNPGGVALLCPDDLRETFKPSTDHGGYDAADGRGLRYLEWSWDPDPDDSTIVTDYAYLLRHADGSAEVVHDRHSAGLFGRQEWLDVLTAAGFEARVVPIAHSEIAPHCLEIFVATRPV